MMSTSSDPIRILHVDDEPDFADMSADFLERENSRFEVKTATSVSEGLDRLADSEFDCLVSDYDMPEISGIEFLSVVRKKYPELPFILYTGKGSETVAGGAISAGVTDYLQKESGASQYELLANRITNAVEKRRARAIVEETEARLQTVAGNINDVLWQFTADWNELLLINSQYEEVWGRSTCELQEKPQSFLNGIHPDDRPRVKDAMETISAGESVDIEYRVNEDEDFKRWVWMQGEPVFADDGSVSSVVGFARDITERKEHEREIRQQREQLQRREEKLIRLRDYTQELMYAESLSETASAALQAVDKILGFDLGAVFIQSETQNEVLESVGVSNRARMEKMYGGIPIFTRDAPPGTHSDLVWEVFETGEAVFINDTANSEVLARKSPFGSLMVYPIGNHGVVLLAATILEAFTETEELLLDLLATALETAFDQLDREQALRRQRDELKRKNERLTEFASVVSHDLRNPLHVADCHLELAREESTSTDHLDSAADALDRMERLVENLLMLAREGESAGETELVELDSHARACWQTTATSEASLRVGTDRAIHADRSRLHQLLENLIRNAIKHGGRDVTVTVGDLPDGFYIADDGIGIPADIRAEIFEPGYSTENEGIGLGLDIVKEVADSHEWDITVTGSDTGGAQFEITDVEFAE